MQTNKERLFQAMRHVHFAQGNLQATDLRFERELTRQAMEALDRAELAILDLKKEDAHE